ncbi:MAG: AMP-binding protein [Bacteroidetes bacterium]|jgi:long-chain acyl-CoA synthetase|nr:AMP-binding protein [Bacteroidota bacterium]
MEPLTERTLTNVLERSVRLFRNRPALGFVDEPPLSFSDLQHEVNHLQHFLREQGVTHGDRVAILGESSPNWAIAYFAVTTMGAVAVPILPEFHTTEVHHILRHSGCKIAFVSERTYQKVESIDEGTFLAVVLLDNLSHVHPRTPKDKLRTLIRDGGKELRKVRNKALKFAGRLKTNVTQDDVASIIYTSGTTGHSKGVVLTHRNIVWNAEASARIPEIGPEDRMLSVLPLAHVYECTLGLVLPVLRGASVTYLRKPPTAPVLLPALSSVKPTAMLTVPLIIEKVIKSGVMKEIQKKRAIRMLYRLPVFRRRINKMAGKKLKAMFGGHLRFFGIGGSALAPDAERFLIEAHFPYAIGYGLTETSPLVAGCNAETSRFRAIGPLLQGVEVRIEGSASGAEIGEIVVRGPGVMEGYYLDPERTAEVLTSDGWFRTGDLGSFDKDGYLYIRGRKKNVILGPSGENIYPEAVESVINRFDIVLESLVFSDQGQLVARIFLDYERLDAEFSEQGLTESQAKERIRQLLEQVRLHVNEQVSAFSKLARVIEQTEPFEKTPTQKIKRYLYADPGEHRAA